MNKNNDWIYQQYVRELSRPKLLPSDYYYEQGRMVMTDSYHKRRGYCCGSYCRHCPYTKPTQKGNTNLQ